MEAPALDTVGVCKHPGAVDWDKEDVFGGGADLKIEKEQALHKGIVPEVLLNGHVTARGDGNLPAHVSGQSVNFGGQRARQQYLAVRDCVVRQATLALITDDLRYSADTVVDGENKPIVEPGYGGDVPGARSPLKKEVDSLAVQKFVLVDQAIVDDRRPTVENSYVVGNISPVLIRSAQDTQRHLEKSARQKQSKDELHVGLK